MEAAKNHPHYSAPISKNQGRGLSCGFWFNFGGDTCVTLNVNFDGTIGVTEGNPDIGGSRASISQMAAEEIGIEYEKVRTIIADTNSLGHNEVTDGSRVTFAVGLATIKAARAAIKEMCKRAAKIWNIDEEAVRWENGSAIPAGPNAGKFDPLTIEEIAGMSSRELLGVLRGLAGLKIISADVVEVAPAYDHAELTSLAAATIAFELINLLVHYRKKNP